MTLFSKIRNGGGGLRVLALLLAGMLACASLSVTVPQPARAADTTPTKVEVSTGLTGAEGLTNTWNVTVDYSDGTMRTLLVSLAFGRGITVYYPNSVSSGAANETLSPPANGMQALSDDAAPGILLGVVDVNMPTSHSSLGNFLRWNAYSTSTACAASGPCLVAGLAAKPQTQTATVAAVPTTGAPSSDLIAPAALLAAGMVGGGLMLRKRRDRNRA